MTKGAPAWLAEALESAAVAPSPPYRTENPTDLSQGDLVVVNPPGRVEAEPRLALITEEPTNHRITVALASNLTWLATRTDPVLDPDLTDLAYRICVFTRMTGPVWREQVVRLVGSVDDDTMEAVLLAQWGEPQDTLKVGFPLLDPALDSRWDDLVAEAANFRRISDYCRNSGDPIEPGQPVPILDPAIFDAGNQNSLADDAAELLALADEDAVRRGELALPVEGIMSLLEEGALLGTGPVAELLIPLLHMAASQMSAQKPSGSGASINGRRCRTPGDRALVWTVLAEAEDRCNPCPRIKTAKSIRTQTGKPLTVASGRRTAQCLLVA